MHSALFLLPLVQLLDSFKGLLSRKRDEVAAAQRRYEVQPCLRRSVGCWRALALTPAVLAWGAHCFCPSSSRASGLCLFSSSCVQVGLEKLASTEGQVQGMQVSQKACLWTAGGAQTPNPAATCPRRRTAGALTLASSPDPIAGGAGGAAAAAGGE